MLIASLVGLQPSFAASSSPVFGKRLLLLHFNGCFIHRIRRRTPGCFIERTVERQRMFSGVASVWTARSGIFRILDEHFSWRRTRNLSEFMNWKLRILDIEHLFTREKFGENQLMRASCRGAVAQLQSTWPAFWPSEIRLVNGNLFISRKALATAGCHPTDADRQETVLLWTVLASCSMFHWLFKRDECLFNWKKKLKSQKHCEQCASLEMAGDPKSLNFENM